MKFEYPCFMVPILVLVFLELYSQVILKMLGMFCIIFSFLSLYNVQSQP